MSIHKKVTNQANFACAGKTNCKKTLKNIAAYHPSGWLDYSDDCGIPVLNYKRPLIPVL